MDNNSLLKHATTTLMWANVTHTAVPLHPQKEGTHKAPVFVSDDRSSLPCGHLLPHRFYEILQSQFDAVDVDSDCQTVELCATKHVTKIQHWNRYLRPHTQNESLEHESTNEPATSSRKLDLGRWCSESGETWEVIGRRTPVCKVSSLQPIVTTHRTHGYNNATLRSEELGGYFSCQ